MVSPHFPNPRSEHAADIIAGVIDAIEFTSWSFLYNGIDPYSLSDYYRYLNCGSFVPAVGRHRQNDRNDCRRDRADIRETPFRQAVHV